MVATLIDTVTPWFRDWGLLIVFVATFIESSIVVASLSPASRSCCSPASSPRRGQRGARTPSFTSTKRSSSHSSVRWGFAIGESWQVADRYLGAGGIVVFVVLAVAFFISWRRVRARLERELEARPGPAATPESSL